MTKADHSSAPVRRAVQRPARRVGALRPALRARRLRRVVRRSTSRARASHDDRRRRRSARSATSTTAARRAPRSTPATAPASCSRSPTASCGRSSTSTLPPAGAYGVGLAFLPARRRPTPRRRWPASSAIVAEEGLRVARLARRPDRRLDDRAHRAERRCPSFRQLFVDDPAGATGIELDRKLFVVRKRCEHEIDAAIDGASVLPVAVVPHARLQGHAHHAAAGRVLPRPRRRARRVGARAGAQPLLHQHVPVVAARAPVPVHRPQRRDQHRAGQPQLDARPRGADEHAADPRAWSARSRSSRPARPTPRASTSASSCCTSAAGRSGTRC